MALLAVSLAPCSVEDAGNKEIRQRVIGQDAWHPPLAATCVSSHMCTYIRHTYTI